MVTHNAICSEIQNEVIPAGNYPLWGWCIIAISTKHVIDTVTSEAVKKR